MSTDTGIKPQGNLEPSNWHHSRNLEAQVRQMELGEPSQPQTFSFSQ